MKGNALPRETIGGGQTAHPPANDDHVRDPVQATSTLRVHRITTIALV
jgi:hypothetical protein